MSDVELGKLTVKELRELRDRVDDAIRANIARARQGGNGAGAGLGEAPAVIDLERERDAWKSWRR